MKNRILTFGVVLVLVTILMAPGAVLATTTGVTGEVVEGYTFTPPPAINLLSMTPGTPATGNSAGSLEGNSPTGYNVKGIDLNTEDATKGYMLIVGDGSLAAPDYILTNELKMGDTATVPNDADVLTTFLTTGAGPIAPTAVPFYVSQTATYADPVQSGYTITITFTVTQNT